MKFFQELASCYRPSTSASPSHEDEYEAPHAVTPLPPGHHHAKRLNKSGGGGGSASSATRHWRPTLQVIREDGVVFGSEARNKIAEKRSHGENKSKPHRVRRNENSFYSRNDNISETMSIPAFSPTPF
ncbi:hypothetical protein F3Y22_tig00110483pilonHSYRG00449 [Hibiscus syriacus]|uniref:Uncharacterized protein n=1 Tax=Hibiscus syriacus TaxID=106335 RepID=A0A6A3AHY4_HIBSY|nr:uncharacterized protein LOC120129158 [Hibiscus syriacus]KAE8702402.1 hypothetical protein F3Y22_tig00110483pilonHSYRG00449 [Hibiscus syriacus]